MARTCAGERIMRRPRAVETLTQSSPPNRRFLNVLVPTLIGAVRCADVAGAAAVMVTLLGG
jgi:hypothetical protein